MDPAGLEVRPARPGDRETLASFVCTSADPRIEEWIRTQAFDRANVSDRGG